MLTFSYGLFLPLLFRHGFCSTVANFQMQTKATYTNLAPCLRFVGSNYPVIVPRINLTLHFEHLLEETAIYRGLSPHRGGKYEGPWIENYFITNFMGRPFENFGGLVPIFVQWSDYHLSLKHNTSKEAMFAPLLNVLRHDVIYIAVSQANQGLDIFFKKFPNVIVMSAGGDGNIAIPLVKGELPYAEIGSEFPSIDVGFYGSTDHGPRKKMFEEIRKHLAKTNLKVKIASGSQWMVDMANTAFNLSPRGFGRASFRLAEIIHIGRIPVYLFDDLPWVPYPGSNVSADSIGYLAQSGSLRKIVEIIQKATPAEIKEKLRRVHAARPYYTYEGVIQQISLFFQDPLGPNGGLLRCTKVPISMESVLDINL